MQDYHIRLFLLTRVKNLTVNELIDVVQGGTALSIYEYANWVGTFPPEMVPDIYRDFKVICININNKHTINVYIEGD